MSKAEYVITYSYVIYFNILESADNDPAAPGLTRKDIFALMKNNLNRGAASAYLEIEKFMSEKLQRPFTLSDDAKLAIRALLSQLNEKWKQASRHEDRFFDKFSTWLSVFVPLEEIHEASIQSSSMGRPSSGFAEASVRSKRRKTEDLRATRSTEELSYAAQMSLRAAGKLDAAKVVQDVTLGSPSRAQKYRKSLESISEIPYTPDKALSLVVELDMSKSDYQKLRNSTREQCCKLFPSYNVIHQAKLQCYPPKSDIRVTECSAEVKLQSLLDHTIQRILLIQDEVIKSLCQESVRNLNLICKWGCDGTSGQNAYKQRFADDTGSKSDANIFFTSLVPLQLISVDQETKNTLVVWKNPRPSSTRFCRPIRIQFLTENNEATVSEMEFIKQQESNLVPYETVIDGKEVTVSFKLAFTMIDGKVCNAITSNASTQRCYLCQATSKDFNDIDAMLKRKINEDFLQFGLSTLHAWIRFFECCLHVGYKLGIEKWQARTANDKENVKNRKATIQKGFRIRLGLIVDQPKPGFGSSNDGNTARRFFEDPTTSASITGVNEDLIKRFHVILQTLSSGHEIDIIRFQDYAVQTARDYVKLYPWFYMPTSMHKILIHSAAIIKSAILPIGQMSEDAQESTNKCIKKNRSDFSRKFSRTKTMEDVFSRLLLTSDPYISSLRKLPGKKMKSFLPEAIQLLTASSVSTNVGSSGNASSVESTDCESDCSGDDE